MAVRRRFKPLFFVVIIMFLGILLLCMGGTCIYLAGPVDKSDEETIEVEIPQGTSSSKISTILKEKELIKSELYFKIYLKFFGKNSLKASTYKLNKTMSLEDIVKSLEQGTTYDPNALVLTFKEGKRITDYVKLIEKNTNYSSDEIIKTINDKEYLKTLIEKYWFLTDAILNTSIYYPLEGYLAPETYFFKQDATIEDIIERLLNEEESVLEDYKDSLDENNIHKVITMASIAELEGTKTDNRKEIIGIFNNRLNSGMNMGSDVTTYYALQLPLTEDLNAEQFATNNPYNTRSTNMIGKLPIGPICNPSKSSLEASVNPSDNDYLYFVADKNGNIFYTKTLSEHNKKIAEIKEKGDWIW